ncbi:Sodium/bile acid cotransporter [Merluccius polli]|uniref:Hepatic sodium/bile acid cotransporter n=1 Tax=Merluccius polli TaxID=89951 RepID=A0AA47P694_MERPO|nr:Sodium/bile acid cotransporter [Merluccius polli]
MDYDGEWLYDNLWSNGSSSLDTGVSNHSSSSNALEFSLSPLLDKIINVCMSITIFITMVMLGCTMDWSKIKEHIKKPKGMIIAAVAQFGIMPLSAYLLAKAFNLDAMQAVAVLICGCCPGGTLSNMLTLPLQGDMNLSIVMTTCSSVLALGMMPLLLYAYCQGFPGLINVVPYGRIIITLVLTIIPCTIGIVITHYRPHWTKSVSKVILAIFPVATLAMLCVAVIVIRNYIFQVMSPSLLTIGFLMPLIGFILGYCLAAIFKLNGSCRRTISMETGCQNIQLATTILKVGFAPEVIGPLFLFPLVYIVFQLSEASVFILLSRCYQRYKTKQKGRCAHLDISQRSEGRVFAQCTRCRQRPSPPMPMPSAKEVFQPADTYAPVEVVIMGPVT